MRLHIVCVRYAKHEVIPCRNISFDGHVKILKAVYLFKVITFLFIDECFRYSEE